MNSSDDKNIRNNIAQFEYVGDGMFCFTKHYKDSGRNTYLFFSADLFQKGFHSASARFEKGMAVVNDIRAGRIRRSDVVTVRKLPGVHVNVTITTQSELMPLSEADRRRALRKKMGIRCGFFKLESNLQLTPSQALQRYRRRAGVEHLLSSLKRVTGIRPIRVWKAGSVDGAMTLALLAVAAISMARYCMEGTVKGAEVGGERAACPSKPSTESIVRSLTHLTLTRFRRRKGRYDVVLSNWGPISEEILATIALHESPDWGDRKIPRSPLLV